MTFRNKVLCIILSSLTTFIMAKSDKFQTMPPSNFQKGIVDFFSAHIQPQFTIQNLLILILLINLLLGKFKSKFIQKIPKSTIRSSCSPSPSPSIQINTNSKVKPRRKIQRKVGIPSLKIKPFFTVSKINNLEKLVKKNDQTLTRLVDII